MKKVFFALLFVGAVQFASAQDEAFKKDVLKLIEVSGGTSATKVMKDQIIKMIPQAKQAEFLKEFDALMPSFYDKMIKVYSEVYTKEDIKGLLAFYETPVGKKMSSKSGELLEKTMNAGNEWATEKMQDLVMKLMQ